MSPFLIANGQRRADYPFQLSQCATICGSFIGVDEAGKDKKLVVAEQ